MYCFSPSGHDKVEHGNHLCCGSLLLSNYESLHSRATPLNKHDDTGACTNAALLTYMLNGDILLFKWTWPALTFRMKTASPLQLKFISGTHVSYRHRHLVTSIVPLDMYTSPAERFSPVCTLSRLSRAGKASFLSVSAEKVSYSWAVYRENPPQFQLGGALIPVCSWHRHLKGSQNTQKCMKCLNYPSLLRFSLLLPNCEGSYSAFIYKFKYKNSNIHPWKGHLTRTCSGDGASLSRWLPFFRSGMKNSRIEPQQRMCHVSRVILPYLHNDTGANAALLAYWIVKIVLFIWTFETKTRPWWPHTPEHVIRQLGGDSAATRRRRRRRRPRSNHIAGGNCIWL